MIRDVIVKSGNDIPIEERDPQEVLAGPLGPVAPVGAKALNPAFDVTPNELVSAIVTDGGIARPPYRESLAGMLS